MPKTDRVVFLVESSFSESEYQRLNLLSLLRQGLTVEVWDCSAALTPGPEGGRDTTAHLGVSVRVFSDLKHVAETIITEAQREVFFVCMLEYRWRSRRVFAALGRARARYCLLLTDVQPFGKTAIRSRLFAGSVAKFRGAEWDSLFFTLPARLWGVRPPELIIAGGASCLTPTDTRVAGSASRVLWAHALDYDRFRNVSRPRRLHTRPTAVFLDQFLEGHPDQFRSGGPFCDPSTYYSNLQRAFESLEADLGIEVLIAAHPRADYETPDARFGKREIVHGRTPELVAECRLVLAHDSTAVGYAVLFGVPVTFITDDGIGRSPIRAASARTMASLLGRRLYNLDREPFPNWIHELKLDHRRYESYRTAFMKREGTPDRPLWDIFADYLEGKIETDRFGDIRR